MKKVIVLEIFIMRTFACLSILLLHVLDRVYNNENQVVNMISVLLTFGTPTFVFISEFILSYSYREKTPSTFWQNRLKYLFIPFLFFGTFYAFLKAIDQSFFGSSFLRIFLNFLWRNILLGEFHGYFILIIFQFYALHTLLGKQMAKYSPKFVIGISLLVNLAYLGFFNFVKPLNIPHSHYIWNQFYWIPFPGWIFYYAIAFYSGYYYASFKQKLLKLKNILIISPVVLGAISIILYNKGILPNISSKRVDMLFFTMSLVFLIYYLSMKISHVPRFFVWISKYSFGIYLFHPLLLGIYASLLLKIPVNIPSILTIPVLFFGSILFSVIIVYTFNKLSFGAFLVGKVGINIQSKKISKKNDLQQNIIKDRNDELVNTRKSIIP